MTQVYLLDWLSLLIKFTHLIVGIAWIGASFYFNWLENNLNRASGQKEGIAGHLWAVHGGGFYYLEKYQRYPNQLPKALHWFKWEAYFTWITGVLLLIVIYYANASVFMLGNNAAITPSLAVVLSLTGLLLAWLIYHFLSQIKFLLDKSWLLAILLLVILFVFSYFYHQYFSPRAAVIQLGAMIGTIMVANVFFVIIPVQRQLVKACQNKTVVSTALGLKGYLRSRHNNYLTLPVLLVMISGHYPFIYSHNQSWWLIVVIMLLTILVRHWFNLRGAGAKKSALFTVLAMAVVGVIAVFIYLIPAKITVNQEKTVSYQQAKQIIDKHCITCHSKTPSDAIFKVAPVGLMLDSQAQIIKAQKQIYARTIATHSMPFNNQSKMTPAERGQLANWLNSLNDENK